MLHSKAQHSSFRNDHDSGRSARIAFVVRIRPSSSYPAVGVDEEHFSLTRTVREYARTATRPRGTCINETVCANAHVQPEKRL